MESDRKFISPLIIMAAVLGLGIATPCLRAETGEVLIAYESSLATIPEQQGWFHEGRSLLTNCPNLTGDLACWYQGSRDLNEDTWPDNNCLPGIGCHLKNPFTEHYNSPDPEANTGQNTYTEWIAFDNGNNGGYRPLVIPDSSIAHSPPWGAPFFSNAPSYPVLRVVTGDGNNVPDTLETIYPSLNNRNIGKTKIRREYNPGTASAFTLVLRAAAGSRAAGRHFVELRAFQRKFAFGVDGTIGSPDYGKLTLVDASTEVDETHRRVIGPLFSQTVLVAQPGTQGPHIGEFFTLRVIVRNNGTFDAYLNENGDQHASGSSAPSSPNPPHEVQLTPVPGDDTMWFDLVQLFEGEIPVSCPDPVVDFNRDGRVDESDFMAFVNCSNGPAVPLTDSFECRCMDRNEDGALDMSDFGVLQRCLTIGTAPLDPACDD